MNPIVKQKWVDALRSGEYKQGSTILRSLNNEFCCLGVLCDIYQKEHGDLSIDSREYYYRYNGHNSLLPQKVGLWANIDEVGRYKLNNTLVADNDNGKTFEEIADIIEEHF